MPLALVTGGTGFVGGAVVRQLAARGWRARVLCRPGSALDPQAASGREVERHEGDLRDPASLRDAVTGCDVLFHVAARYAFGALYARELYRDNVEGTRNILAAAREAGVSRVVYTSTVGVLRARADGVPVDENALAGLAEVSGPYKRSKWLAEQEALRAAAAGLPVVIVCPTAPVGPGDLKPTPTGRMILDFLRGRMKAYVETGLNLVGVDDMAAGHLLAAERGTPGRRYILGMKNVTLREIFQILSELSGIPAPRVRLPRLALWPLAFASEAAAFLLRRPPPIPLEALQMTRNYMYFDCSRAREEIGYRPGPVEQALEGAIRWYTRNGYLSRHQRERIERGLPAANCRPQGDA